MIDPIKAASGAAASGLYAQSLRMRVVAENIANADSTGASPGADPYRRKTIAFRQSVDAMTGASIVSASGIARDPSAFPVENRPGHPAADASGRVKTPNVNMIVEMADMRRATHSYEANLQVIRQCRDMTSALIDLMRSGA
jgi:flagellar basal-body rod protein FlgC